MDAQRQKINGRIKDIHYRYEGYQRQEDLLLLTQESGAKDGLHQDVSNT